MNADKPDFTIEELMRRIRRWASLSDAFFLDDATTFESINWDDGNFIDFIYAEDIPIDPVEPYAKLTIGALFEMIGQDA